MVGRDGTKGFESSQKISDRFPFHTERDDMKIQSLGHVVIKVRNKQRAEAFYNGLLGIPIVARSASPVMTFFTLGSQFGKPTLELDQIIAFW